MYMALCIDATLGLKTKLLGAWKDLVAAVNVFFGSQNGTDRAQRQL